MFKPAVQASTIAALLAGYEYVPRRQERFGAASGWRSGTLQAR